VTLLGKLFRLVWGGDIDPALRPVLAVGLVGSIAGATVYPFMGIWAIKHLHAPQNELAFAYLAGAVLELPFLLLNATGSLATVAVVILVFVVGEMLWVPTSQAVVAALAPADIRGAYMGAFGGTWSVGLGGDAVPGTAGASSLR
jgi:hypothetical protein